MFDHIGVRVGNLATARAFYEAAFAPLGITPIMVLTATDTGGAYEGVGYGRDGKPAFWVSAAAPPSGPIHVAFAAPDRATVNAFHRAALAAGGRDNGAPGLRPHYHPSYYGAFVLDPDGNNVEAVCHRPA
jgi:catechol 2,3-dioxygenase-like lactoylglutathione lyase family enzyme